MNVAGGKTATAVREAAEGHSAPAGGKGRGGRGQGSATRVEEVPIGRYLAERRPIPHLFELTPDLDPAAFALEAVPDGPPGDVSGTALASTVRAGGDRETDVRLLVDGGERYLTLANDLANTLYCDVYLTPRDAVVRYVHESNSVAGDSWEAVAVDRASGQPVDWLVVRPLGLPAHAATWFVSHRGRLRRGQGLVTVALPDGVGFATRATYRDTTHLAARLMPSRHALSTLAVNAELGRFEIARFEDEPVDQRGDGSPQRRRLAFARGGRDQEAVPTGASRAGTRLGGAEFATLVRASLDVIHPDVQVALTWPKDADACTTLHAELLALAEGLTRTVWVPEPPGAAFVQNGFGEFVAVDEVGTPSRWRAYPPSSAKNLTTLFGTDLDGRLTPLGEVAAARFGGVRFVSVPAPQLEHLRRWYSTITPPPGLFPIDLTVLPDGRLGVMLRHGVGVVAGPRELQVMLREAGWRGEDLLLLAQPPAPVWNVMIDHARGLVEGLRTDLWLATLGAEVWVQADGTLAADGPDGGDQAWCCVAFGRATTNVTLPAALAVPRLSDDGRVVPRPGYDPIVAAAAVAAATAASASAVVASVASTVPSASVASAQVAVSAAAGLAALTAPAAASVVAPAVRDPYGLDYYAADDLTVRMAQPPADAVPPPVPDGPAASVAASVPPLSPDGTTGAERGPAPLGRALGAQAPHAVPWLPESPVVNQRPMDLYLWTPLTNDQVEAWGLPSADLFLLAGQDPLRLADRRPTGYVLRLRAPAGSAVDLAEHARHAPAGVQQRLVDTGNTHLLPLAWLRDMRVTARFDLDGAGGVRARTDVGAGELAIRFEGAEHGVTGLPNEVVNWPDKGSRADAPSYLLLPEESDMNLTVIHGGYVALSRKKPPMPEGCRLLEVKVRRRRAIDVPATLDSLAGMNITGRMHDFVGLDLLLSEADLGKAVVTKIWHHGPGSRPTVDKLSGETLYDALLDESILTGRGEPPPDMAAA